MMNLAGMGANAKIIEVAKGKVPNMGTGYFWCEALQVDIPQQILFFQKVKCSYFCSRRLER